MKGKSVTILQEAGVPDSLNTVALITATHSLGGNVARMTVEPGKMDVQDLARYVHVLCLQWNLKKCILSCFSIL